MAMDLEVLRLMAWLALGLLLVGFALCQGLGLGVCALLPVLAETEDERQDLAGMLFPASVINFAWGLLLLAFTFAVWPILYSVALVSAFSLLVAVIPLLAVQPVLLFGFAEPLHGLWLRHRANLLTVSGFLPAALLGVLAGNVMKGVPFHLESDMHIAFMGDFAGMFNLFSLLVACCVMALWTMHAAVFVQLKADGALRQRAKGMALRAGLAFTVLFALAGLWITHLEGYHISSDILPQAASNPLAKFVKRGEGLWLDNYEHLPQLWLLPGLAFAAALAVLVLSWRNQARWAMIASSLCVSMAVSVFGVSLFPFLLPSNLSLNSSLTLWDSSASRLPLTLSLTVMAAVLPLMALYSRWAYGAVKGGAAEPNGCETVADMQQ